MVRGKILAHLAVTTETRREFCRRLFRVGATASLRTAFLDGLSDSATAAQQSGNAIQSASANGADVTFQFFAGWSPDSALELINEARGWVGTDASTEAESLALIVDNSGGYVFNFYGLRVT